MTNRAELEECGNCRFWRVRSDPVGERGGGYCVRFPPSYPAAFEVTSFIGNNPRYQIEAESRMNDAWPMVHQQSWCGEWQPLRARLAQLPEDAI